MKDFEELQEKVLDWADGKNLLQPRNYGKQFKKFIEEVFEFKAELDNLEFCSTISELQYSDSIKDNIKMEFGDVFVTLIILAKQLNLNINECLEMAYDKIKDRKGKTIDGQFIKEEDL